MIVSYRQKYAVANEQTSCVATRHLSIELKASDRDIDLDYGDGTGL